MVDENEGIDSLLRNLEIDAGPCRGAIGLGWANHDEAVAKHSALKHRYFLSSWTREAESIAMWNIYSKDYLGVRIRSTTEKLHSAFRRFLSVEGRDVILSAAIGNEGTVVSEVAVEAIQYENLQRLYTRAARRQRAFLRLEARATRHSKVLEVDMTKKWTFLRLPDTPFLLKDTAYQHEQEIRGILRVGRFVMDKEWFEIVHREDVEDYLQYVVEEAQEKDFPPYLRIPVPEDFVEEACIDPRCPSYRREFIERQLEAFAIPVVESNAFGYLPRSSMFMTHPKPRQS